jgi:hypothetical protein
LPSTWWWSSWPVSAGIFFFDLFCGGIVSYFSVETQWAPMLWGIRKFERDPRTQACRNTKYMNVQARNRIHERRDKESPKDCSCLKSCESLCTCPRAPFYREAKGFLHSENTLESKEIFIVWTCTWMSFTSRDLQGSFHTFTSLPLVHTPNVMSLTWLLTDSWVSYSWKSSYAIPSEFGLQ